MLISAETHRVLLRFLFLSYTISRILGGLEWGYRCVLKSETLGATSETAELQPIVWHTGTLVSITETQSEMLHASSP